MSVSKQIGRPATRGGTWVQTDRAAHEAWARLAVDSPRAAALLHVLVARMGDQNAVVISQALLSKMMRTSVATIKRALADLVAGSWIQVVQIGPGTASAYVVNARVAWARSREDLHTAVFSATVIADLHDQDQMLEGTGPLRRIPVMFPGERQLPSGPGEMPPSQPIIEGMEPDLPAIDRFDPETGELFDK